MALLGWFWFIVFEKCRLFISLLLLGFFFYCLPELFGRLFFLAIRIYGRLLFGITSGKSMDTAVTPGRTTLGSLHQSGIACIQISRITSSITSSPYPTPSFLFTFLIGLLSEFQGTIDPRSTDCDRTKSYDFLTGLGWGILNSHPSIYQPSSKSYGGPRTRPWPPKHPSHETLGKREKSYDNLYPQIYSVQSSRTRKRRMRQGKSP